jgi:hypothetical protein
MNNNSILLPLHKKIRTFCSLQLFGFEPWVGVKALTFHFLPNNPLCRRLLYANIKRIMVGVSASDGGCWHLQPAKAALDTTLRHKAYIQHILV